MELALTGCLKCSEFSWLHRRHARNRNGESKDVIEDVAVGAGVDENVCVVVSVCVVEVDVDLSIQERVDSVMYGI